MIWLLGLLAVILLQERAAGGAMSKEHFELCALVILILCVTFRRDDW